MKAGETNDMTSSPSLSEGNPDEETSSETNSLLPKTVDPSNISMNDFEDDATSAKNTILGMICVAVGTGFICTVGAMVQSHGGSVLEIMQGRYFIQNLISLLWWKFKKPENAQSWFGDPPYRANIWVRGILYWVLVFTWWRGLEMVALGDAEAILFLSPVLTVVIARLWLKEPLPHSFPVTVILVVAGVVFVCQPPFIFGGADAEPISIGGFLFLMGCCLSWTLVSLLVRTAKDAHWLQLEIVSSGQAFWLWTPLLILLNRTWWKSDALSGGGWDYKPMTWLLMFGSGFLGFCGLCLNVIGYQIGDATKVAWMEYLDLVFAFIYQWGVFKQVPNKWEFAGIGLLLSCCVVHLLEEVYRMYKDNKKIKINRINNENIIKLSMDAQQTHQKHIIHGIKETETDPLLPIQHTRTKPVRKLSLQEKLTQIFERMTIFSIESSDH